MAGGSDPPLTPEGRREREARDLECQDAEGGERGTAQDRRAEVKHIPTPARVATPRPRWHGQNQESDPCSPGRTGNGGRERSSNPGERETHAGQYNALVGPHRQLAKVAGTGWVEVAQDFQVWSNLGGSLWQGLTCLGAGGNKGHLQNLTPNTTMGGRRHTTTNEVGMLTA